MDHIQKVLSAASTGDEDMMKSYIASGSITCLDEEGSTPLMYAAANGHEKLVRLLLQNGVDVDEKNCYGWTALLQASCYGHHEVVYTLLQHGAQINAGNSWGTTPLVAACQGRFVSIVQDLLDRGASINIADEVVSITPLMAAAQCGSEMIVEKLLTGGSNPNARLSITGWTALMLAALNDHVSVVRMLLNQGAVREMRDVNNNRAIDLALSLKHSKVVDSLSEDDTISSSTDVDIFDVVKQSNVEMLQEVLTKHKVSATVTDKDGATPLMYAARKSNMQICQLLIDLGADIDAQDYYHGWTAFMHAVHHKQHNIACLLAESGANVTLKAKNGSSAFDIANLIGDAAMINLIAQVTIQNLNKKDNVKITITPLPTVQEEATPSPVLKDPSPPSGSDREDEDEVSTEAILRRLSNAYLASGTPNLLEDEKGFLRPRGRRSPFSVRSPSPDPEPHQVLPAITKPYQPHPLSPRAVSPVTLPIPVVPLKVTVNPLPKLQFVFHDRTTSRLGNAASTSRLGNAASTSRLGNAASTSRLGNAASTSRLGNAVSSSRLGNVANSGRNQPPPIRSPRSFTSNVFMFPDLSPPQRDLALPKRDGPRSSLRPRPPFGSRSHGNQSKSERPRTLLPLKLKPPSNKGPDLKTALENASLGQYYPILKEQEMDTHTFLTLTDQDFIDLGVAIPQDRTHLLALSNRLRDLQSPRSPRSPKSPGRAGSAFQYSFQ